MITILSLHSQQIKFFYNYIRDISYFVSWAGSVTNTCIKHQLRVHEDSKEVCKPNVKTLKVLVYIRKSC